MTKNKKEEWTKVLSFSTVFMYMKGFDAHTKLAEIFGEITDSKFKSGDGAGRPRIVLRTNGAKTAIMSQHLTEHEMDILRWKVKTFFVQHGMCI